MGAKSLLLIGGIATATLLYLVYLAATFEAPEGTTTVVIPPPALQPVVTENTDRQTSISPPAVAVTSDPAPTSVVEAPAIEPEPAVAVTSEPEPALVELPRLNNSDSFVAERLQQLQSGASLMTLLADEQLVRRFVVLVDNVARGTLPQSNLPYRELAAEFPVTTIDENLFELDVAGYQRFASLIDTLIGIDPEQAMALYRVISPLFQQAYAEIGFRDVNFDDTLRRAIRTVLETEEFDGSLQLIKPSVMYLFADSRLEALSDVQKQLLRIGPENTEKLKTRLRQYLQLL